jgi:AraC-like DNA-binding protein
VSVRQDRSPTDFERATIRIAGLRTAIELLRDLELDPKQVAAASGFPFDRFRDPDSEAPLATTLKLLAECVRVSALPHFALLAGARNRVSTLGVFGHLAMTAPDVRTAIEDAIRFLSVYDRVATVRLTVEHDVAAVNYLFDFPSAPGAEHFCDGAVASISRILGGICGEEWKPLRVKLSRRRPADAGPYVEIFGSEVGFGAEYASIEFPTRWLRRAPPGANESLRAYLAELVRQVEQKSGAEIERVRRVIRTQLVGGRPNADLAAAVLGVHRRTLARRLSAEGLTFKRLAGDLRFEMASDMLAKSGAPVARIAEMLGYSDQTTFSRAFSKRFGRPPSLARRADA